MSDKTLKRLVLGQLVLLVVIAAVLVWVIIPKDIGVRPGWEPKQRLEQMDQKESRPAPWYSRSDPYEEQRQMQRLNDRINCLERKAAARDDRFGQFVLGC